MSFVLKLNDPGDSGTQFGDDAKFEINPNGTLTVVAAGEVAHYAPTYWQAVQIGRRTATPVRTGHGPLGSN